MKIGEIQKFKMFFSNAIKNLKITEYKEADSLANTSHPMFEALWNIYIQKILLWNSEIIQALLSLKIWIMAQDSISVEWVLKMLLKKLEQEKLLNLPTLQPKY